MAEGSTSQLTISGTTLTVAMLASHAHRINHGGGDSGYNEIRDGSGPKWYTCEATGGNAQHTHNVTDGGHSHTGTVSAVATIPPYIKLVYCVKIRDI